MTRLVEKARQAKQRIVSEQGRVLPYAIAWWFGVPLFLLVLIYLIRGH